MRKYDLLDSAILQAINRGQNPMLAKRVTPEAIRIGWQDHRAASSVIKARLGVLRRAGRIVVSPSACGWQVWEGAPETAQQG